VELVVAGRRPVGSLEESTLFYRAAANPDLGDKRAKNYFSGRNAQTTAEWKFNRLKKQQII
jgi:hypothetical protein